MPSGPDWRGFGKQYEPIVSVLMGHFPGCHSYQHMLSVVMPGHDIPPHVDPQDPRWLVRVHVPLTTNEQSQFIVDGKHHHMDLGFAYLVNTLAEHAVVNNGATPRIHFMFDVRAQ
jgi:aspartyl/asparaginyl beta-hydroxylase (cupin superfamily)